ncbi:MAG: polysaccharide deacetylase family protein [Candidatus Absconditabacterales bacterium]
MHRTKRILIVLCALLLACVGLFYISKSRNFQFFGGLVNNIQTQKRIVALTFDDGPSPGNTQKTLEILRNHGIKATFFLIGREIEAYPSGLQLIMQAGHQVGNHSYSHTRMVLKSPSFVVNEITKTDEIIREAGYTGEILFRTPYGKRLVITPYYLRQFHKPNIFFDVEPETYVQGSGALLEYALQHVHPGSIILLHPMYSGTGNQTLGMLDNLIVELKKRDFDFVTVDELLGQTNTVPHFW